MGLQISSSTRHLDGRKGQNFPQAMPPTFSPDARGRHRFGPPLQSQGYPDGSDRSSAPVEVMLRLSGEPAAVRSDTPPTMAAGSLKHGDDIPVIHFQVHRDVLQYLREATCRTSTKTGESSNRLARSPILERLTTMLEAAGLRTELLERDPDNAMRLALVASLFDVQPRPVSALQHTYTASGLSKWRLKRVLDHIDANIAGPIRLSDLAAVAGMSRMYFASQFRAATGMRPHDCILRRRVEHAQKLLMTTTDSLVDVALGAGFETQAHFTTVFKKYAGDTPNQWRRQQRCVTS